MKAQQYVPIIVLRKIKLFFIRIKDIVTLFKSGLISEASCYPELPRKSKASRAFQLLWYLLKYGEILWQYNLYGLDVKPFKAMDEYIGNKELMWREFEYNILRAKNDYTNIMRDKRLFYLFLRANGFNTPAVFAYSKDGVIYPFGWRMTGEWDVDSIPVDSFLKNSGKYFCKPYNGKCGRGIFILQVGDDIIINGEVVDQEHAVDFLSSAFKDEYIIQDVLVQHPEMAALNPSSVNTIRIITGRNKKTKQVEFITGFLRIGGKKSMTDNMAGGGMAVGIDFETGYLKHYGYFFADGGSRRIEEHPELKIPLETIQVPHLKEAVQTSIELHEKLDDLQIIGWDVAVTEDSVSFIEGNDSPGLSQSNHGPKRRVIDQYI